VIPEGVAEVTEFARAGTGRDGTGAPSAVVLLTDRGVRVVTADGEWHATGQPVTGEPGAGEPGTGESGTGESGAGESAATGALTSGRLDALVAGFVPGIALGWSWPDMLRHALALVESVTSDGEADLAAYEKLLPEVTVTGPRG
jgi:hypothetical protein